MAEDVHTEPMDIRTRHGAVIVLGPFSMHGAFTPDAAQESGLQLLEAARRARTWVNLAPPGEIVDMGSPPSS